MNTFQRTANLAAYEWRRAMAKKKFLVLVILALALQMGVFVLFNYFFTQAPPPGVGVVGPSLQDVKATMWLVGVLGPQGLFIPLIGIMIAGGSMSEEYEHGSADILLSKPVTRIEYMAGKFLGDLSLLGFMVALTTSSGVIMAYGFFGSQESLQFAPSVYLVLIYSNLLFFSLAFMFSEVFRRTTLAMLATIGILVGSTVVGGYLSVMYTMTRDQIYLEVTRWLPNWSVSNLPSFFIAEIMTVGDSPFISVMSGDVWLATAIIAVYTVVSLTAATLRLVKSDVTKKAD